MKTNRPTAVKPGAGAVAAAEDPLLALIGTARAVAYEAKAYSATATFCLEMGVLELEKEWQARNGNVVKFFPGRGGPEPA